MNEALTYEQWKQGVVVLALMKQLGIEQIELSAAAAIRAGDEYVLISEEDKINDALVLRLKPKRP